MICSTMEGMTPAASKRNRRAHEPRSGRPAANEEPGFTVEGNLARVGEFAAGLRRAAGARRLIGYALLATIAVPVAVGVVLGIAEVIGRL